MVGNDLDIFSATVDELISDLDGTPHEASVKCFKEQYDAIIKLRTEANELRSFLVKKRAEEQNLKKSKLADEEHKLVSDRFRQLLGWERE